MAVETIALATVMFMGDTVRFGWYTNDAPDTEVDVPPVSTIIDGCPAAITFYLCLDIWREP